MDSFTTWADEPKKLLPSGVQVFKHDVKPFSMSKVPLCVAVPWIPGGWGVLFQAREAEIVKGFLKQGMAT